nr:MAG TPA: hypothetical protein [Caudoviricetes sp.]
MYYYLPIAIHPYPNGGVFAPNVKEVAVESM